MASYTIQKGDTLSKLAKRFNTSVSELAALNHIENPNKIYVGDVLELPGTKKKTESGGASLETYLGKSPAYSPSASLESLAAELSQKETQKPGAYAGAYEDRIRDLLEELEGREDFQYDYAKDPLYRQYRDSYSREGKLAMLDSMGNAAALTGGYGSSYGATVGQQSYQNYLAKLNDVIPELYQAAYQRYRDEGDALFERLGLYQDLDAKDYGRYRDSVEDYYSELDYYYDKYSDMSKAEYERYKTDLSAWMEDRDFYYRKEKEEQAEDGKKSASSSAASSGKSRTEGSKPETSSKEIEGIHQLFREASPYERSQLYSDETTVKYLREVLGEDGFEELLLRYPA